MPHDQVEIVCLSPTMKEVVRKELQTMPDEKEKSLFLRLLGDMMDCKKGLPIDFEHINSDGNGNRGDKKRKRKRSGYQNFTSECLKKSEGASIKSCAATWRGLSEREKAGYKP